MAENKEIHQLTEVTTLIPGTDMLAIVNDGETKKIAPTADPGAAPNILATGADGSIALGTDLLVVDVPADTVSFGGKIILENGETIDNSTDGLVEIETSKFAAGTSADASGEWATVCGGLLNRASGILSFAAGRRAKATAQGAFVLADSQNIDFTIDTTNTFGARFAGGYQFMGGNVGFGCDPARKVDIDSNILRLRIAKTPATAGAAGFQGDICWDADFVYICVAANSWKRAAIAAW